LPVDSHPNRRPFPRSQLLNNFIRNLNPSRSLTRLQDLRMKLYRATRPTLRFFHKLYLPSFLSLATNEMASSGHFLTFSADSPPRPNQKLEARILETEYGIQETGDSRFVQRRRSPSSV